MAEKDHQRPTTHDQRPTTEGGGEAWLGSDGVARFIEKDAADDAAFERLALSLFAEQYERISVYGDYCRRLGHTPETVRRWQEIPALPIEAFKHHALVTFPVEQAQRTFLTSGTARGPERRGRVLKDAEALELHDASVLAGFRRWGLPDREQIRILVLAPPTERVPTLRMAHDCSLFVRRFGTPGSGHFVGEGGLDCDGIVRILRDAEASGEPVLLIGATFSFVWLLEHCRERGIRFQLPVGSRTLDGGGYKGRSRELTKAEFLDTATEVLGVPPSHVVNLLGITEVASLFYDNVLGDALAGRDRPRHKPNVPWTRTLAADPDTLEPLPPGEVGLLRHYDLASARNLFAIQTEDLGREVADGFEIHGRAVGAELRGCSLAMEEMLGVGDAVGQRGIDL
jgi:hypothetical protein